MFAVKTKTDDQGGGGKEDQKAEPTKRPSKEKSNDEAEDRENVTPDKEEETSPPPAKKAKVEEGQNEGEVSVIDEVSQDAENADKDQTEKDEPKNADKTADSTSSSSGSSEVKVLDEAFEVDRVLDYSWCRATKRGLYRVSWAGYDDSENTWEPVEHLEGAGEKLKEFYQKRLAEREQASPKE